MMHDVWIEKFKKEVLPVIMKDINPSRVLLFGSRITGNATEDSDIDVIIISETFNDIPFIDRMGHILKLKRFPKHVDYLCYTPEEFINIKDSSSIIEHALEHFEEAIPIFT